MDGSMTRRARNAPVQLIPSDRELEMLADLRLWWGERHASNVLRTLLVTAWAAEQAKRQADGTQQQQEAA
jgi:hypothetical protein